MNFDNSKIQILFKPCQSGKTREFLNTIRRTEEIELNQNDINVIHEVNFIIIFNM